MSEAILYAIDALQVKDADAAAGFVDKWQGSSEAPTTRIATFSVRLLQTWPMDGSKGAVWYEDFSDNSAAGSVLEMTFELGTFDGERLQQLRAIAKDHGVHVFDPEGHVLYLADGGEAGAPGMAAPVPGAPSQCTSGVRFDGVYESKMGEKWNYLCFNADGKIFWIGIGRRLLAREAMDFFIAGKGDPVKGNYKPGANAFNARLKADFGAFKMNGVLKEGGLHVHSERTNGKYPFDAVYSFLPL